MARADFLELPVHAGGAVVVNLDAIHADVALAGVGVFGDDAGEGDEAPAVERPALLDREVGLKSWGVEALGVGSIRLAARGSDIRRTRSVGFPEAFRFGAAGSGDRVRVGGASNCE